MAQHHILYMTYIESHYPEINIKDLISAEFKFVGKGHFHHLSSRIFNDYLGKIEVNKEDDNHPLKYVFTIDHSLDDDDDDEDDDDEDDVPPPKGGYYIDTTDSEKDDEPPRKRNRTCNRNSDDSEEEEVDDNDNPQRYSPTSPSYCP